jgi:CheY-like chemotaxis protein
MSTVEAPTQPARVLVVDDEPSILMMLGDLLTLHGCEVATASSGMEALERVTSFPADVVLLDVLMPGMSGNDTLAALRERGVRTPAIAVTGMPEKAGGGFLAVLSKPIDLARLTSLITTARTMSGGA